MKGKGNVKVHIVARKAQNTSFKKKVGQALLSILFYNKKSSNSFQ